MVKHQANCYRNIKGVKYMNYCDLIMGDIANADAITEAENLYHKVKVITHWTKEYKQLFVAEPKITN